MSEQFKVSVIGVGHLGSIHARLWSNLAGEALAGVYDEDAERANTIAKEIGTKAFATLDEAFSSANAVTIAVPTTLHFEVAMKAIERGIHCLIEKPITQTYSEAQKLISAARQKGVTVQVGHVERFNPSIAAIKNLGISPLFIEAHRLSQFKPRAIDVSVIHDLMIHDIDIALWLAKSPVESISANGVAVLTETTDIANARINFKNGAVANLTASRISARPMRKMRIFQKNAYISIDFGKQEVEVFKLLREGETGPSDSVPATMLGMLDAGVQNQKIGYFKPRVENVNAIAEEQIAFRDTILSGTPVAVSAEEASEALRIAELIAEQVK